MSEKTPFDQLTADFISEFIEAQNAAGLTPAFLSTALKRLIKSKKTDTFKGTVEQFSDGFLISKEDVVIYSKPLEDNGTRLKALTLALNLRGLQTSSPQGVQTVKLIGDPNNPLLIPEANKKYLEDLAIKMAGGTESE